MKTKTFTKYVPKESPASAPFEDWCAVSKENWNRLMEIDKAAKKAGQLLGRIVRVQYADGYAVYQITKVNKSTVRVEVCTGLGDDWVLPMWGQVDTVPTKQVLKYISWYDGLDAIFGR